MPARRAPVRSLAWATIVFAVVAGAAALPQSAGARQPVSRAASDAQAPTPAVSVQLAMARRHIKHVIVIVMENHTFDSMYGTYPGANGLPITAGRSSRKGRCATGPLSTCTGRPTSRPGSPAG